MEEDINLLSNFLTQVEAVYKRNSIKQSLELNSLVEDIYSLDREVHHIDYSWLSHFQNKPKVSEFEDVLLGFQKIKDEESTLSKEKSIRFNVLNFFHIDENLHSRLLGFFLDKNASHGQGDAFLKKFIEKLGYTDYEEGKWNITIEKQRIDILIERNYPHSVIIIENKSNNAFDQNNQIYRYWHRAIYLKNRKASTDNEKYKIIYLVSNDGKSPSENTFKKPENYSKDLPLKVPLKVEVWTFNSQIGQWLDECLSLLSENNYRLKEYIKQYIEHWK